MKAQPVWIAITIAFLTFGASGAAGPRAGSPGVPGAAAARGDPAGGPSAPTTETFERHHYSMTARVRPLLVFWISRSGVGDAVVTRRRAPGEAEYSLLIGTDPERAPRRINRWGYIDEAIRGAEASLIGLMTQSDEQTVEAAEASVRRQGQTDHTFKIIQATVDREESRSVVKSIRAPASYTFRDVGTLLEMARQEPPPAGSRIVRLPAGIRPGFLSALAELMHVEAASVHEPNGRHRALVPFVYHGRLYELRATRARALASFPLGSSTYRHVVVADFEIQSSHDGEVTPFSMTFGTQAPLAEVPILMVFQPRWWMQVELALDDTAGGLTTAGGAHP